MHTPSCLFPITSALDPSQQHFMFNVSKPSQSAILCHHAEFFPLYRCKPAYPPDHAHLSSVQLAYLMVHFHQPGLTAIHITQLLTTRVSVQFS